MQPKYKTLKIVGLLVAAFVLAYGWTLLGDLLFPPHHLHWYGAFLHALVIQAKALAIALLMQWLKTQMQQQPRNSP